MMVSDLKYELRVYKDDVCIMYRLLTDDNLLAFINAEVLDFDFIKGETRIEISLWNGIAGYHTHKEKGV